MRFRSDPATHLRGSLAPIVTPLPAAGSSAQLAVCSTDATSGGVPSTTPGPSQQSSPILHRPCSTAKGPIATRSPSSTSGPTTALG